MERRPDALLTFTCEADRSWREGPRGAWLVKLGPDAFEPLAPPAMQRLAWLHERLPRLGLREEA